MGPVLLAVTLAVAPPVERAPVERGGDEAELARLREALELPAGAPLHLASDDALPAAAALKVCLETGLDTQTRDNLNRWTQEWNRKRKSGRLEIVKSAEEADVVLARLVDETKARSKTQTFVTPQGGPRTSTGTVRNERHSFTVYEAPVRSYVLRAAEGGFEIVWRQSNVEAIDPTKGTGRELWDAFRKLLEPKR